MWMTAYISPQKGRKTEVFLLFSERKENIGPIRVNSKSKANEAFSGTKCHRGHKICSRKLERLLLILILLENNFLLPSFGHSFIDKFSRL